MSHTKTCNHKKNYFTVLFATVYRLNANIIVGFNLQSNLNCFWTFFHFLTDFLENKNLIQIPVPFKVANLISNNENKIREQLWNTAQAGKKQSNWKDNRG